jgi:hypothetical protein
VGVLARTSDNEPLPDRDGPVFLGAVTGAGEEEMPGRKLLSIVNVFNWQRLKSCISFRVFDAEL